MIQPFSGLFSAKILLISPHGKSGDTSTGPRVLVVVSRWRARVSMVGIVLGGEILDVSVQPWAGPLSDPHHVPIGVI
jgi:hypothetical protein